MDKKRILVVDDEPHLVRSLTFILGKEGYEVHTAIDGEEAIKKVREHSPALLLLDLMMPRKNGYEVCQEIRSMENSNGIYVIVLSAKGSETDKEKALGFGANEFISKPFSPVEVVSRVKQILK